jgi:hypothetical protein
MNHKDNQIIILTNKCLTIKFIISINNNKQLFIIKNIKNKMTLIALLFLELINIINKINKIVTKMNIIITTEHIKINIKIIKILIKDSNREINLKTNIVKSIIITIVNNKCKENKYNHSNLIFSQIIKITIIFHVMITNNFIMAKTNNPNLIMINIVWIFNKITNKFQWVSNSINNFHKIYSNNRMEFQTNNRKMKIINKNLMQKLNLNHKK